MYFRVRDFHIDIIKMFNVLHNISRNIQKKSLRKTTKRISV